MEYPAGGTGLQVVRKFVCNETSILLFFRVYGYPSIELRPGGGDESVTAQCGKDCRLGSLQPVVQVTIALTWFRIMLFSHYTLWHKVVHVITAKC